MASKKNEEKSVNAPPAKTEGVQQTSLANVQMSSISSSAPDWLKKKMGNAPARGLEKADVNDIIIPRLVLCQALTPAVADGKRRAGDIMDNLTQELLVKQGEKLQIIPMVFSKTRMYLKPMGEGGGVLCRSMDAITAQKGGCGKDIGDAPTIDCLKCVHKDWDDSRRGEKDGGKPKCSGFYNIACLLPEFDYRPFVWSGKATQLKPFKRLISIAKTTGVDLFALRFNIFAVDAVSGANKFKNWDIEVPDGNGYVSEQEYQRAEQWMKTLEGKTWKADTTDIEAEGDVDGTEAAPF